VREQKEDRRLEPIPAALPFPFYRIVGMAIFSAKNILSRSEVLHSEASVVEVKLYSLNQEYGDESTQH
jgi:hypothetical protein